MDALDSPIYKPFNARSLPVVDLPDYLSNYGLSSDPFAPVADFFPGAGRQSLLDTLHHQILFSSSLLAVGGSDGVGKSCLSRQLLASFDDDVKVCSMAVAPGATLATFIGDLALALGLSSLAGSPVGLVLSELRRHFQSPEGDDSLSLLLLDDAHNLDESSLSTLIGLLQGQASLEHSVCVVLFAEPNFLGRLAVADLGDLLLSDYYLECFDVAQLRKYLDWRFELAGAIEELPFSDQQLRDWLLSSDGSLSKVHQLVGHYMMDLAAVDNVADDVVIDFHEPDSTEVGSIASNLPVMHLVAIFVLFSALLLAYFLNDTDEPKRPPAEVVSLPAPKITALNMPTPTTVKGQALDKKLESLGLKAGSSLEAVDDLPVVAADDAETAIPAATIIDSSLEPDESVSRAQAKEVVAEAVVQPIEKAVAEPIIVTKKVTPKVTAPVLSADETRLLAMTGSNFTLQVLAANSRNSVEAFVANQPNSSGLFVFSSLRKGAPWYVVVVGSYASIEQARAAIARLPKAQREAGPWPRRLDSVQSDIRKYHQI